MTLHPPVARSLLTAAVLSLLCSAAHAQSWEQPAPKEHKGWFAVALLPRLGDVLVSVAQQGAGCVFSRLLNFLGAGPNPSCSNNAQNMNYVQPGAQFNSQGPYNQGYNQQQPYANNNGFAQQINSPYAQATTQGGTAAPSVTMNLAPATGAMDLNQGAAGLAVKPLLTFVVQKLANASPRAPVLSILTQAELSGQTEPSFQLHTGDAFALTFSTTVPGRVRLINTDADQAVSVSSIYEAVPGGDNRMPREHEGGVLLTGRAGVEYLDVEFVPCVSAGLSQHPAVQAFAQVLPACAAEPATKQYRPALANGSGGLAELGGKAMVFPANADPSQPVALAPGNYAKGETLRFRLRIDHLAAQ